MTPTIEHQTRVAGELARQAAAQGVGIDAYAGPAARRSRAHLSRTKGLSPAELENTLDVVAKLLTLPKFRASLSKEPISMRQSICRCSGVSRRRPTGSGGAVKSVECPAIANPALPDEYLFLGQVTPREQIHQLLQTPSEKSDLRNDKFRAGSFTAK